MFRSRFTRRVLAVASGCVLHISAFAQFSPPADPAGPGTAVPAPAAASVSQAALASPLFFYELDAFIRKQSSYASELRRLAEAGDRLGMARFCAIAVVRRYEIGPDQRAEDAIPYCRRLARQGVPIGMLLYGIAYTTGRGVGEDYAEAVRWFRRAAQEGDTQAMLWLGFLHENGAGVAKSEPEALRWFQRAAQKGDSGGMLVLGEMYAFGRGGLPKDIDQAVQWYRKAAASGNDQTKQLAGEGLRALGR